MKKLINDTLKNPVTGKYSRKNIVLFVSFNFLIIYEGLLPITSQILKFWFPDIEYDTKEYVFDGMLLFITALLGIQVADKKIGNNSR